MTGFVLVWKTGFEIELLAPLGLSRRDLAVAIADRAGGKVRPFFHPQAEVSEVTGIPIFENLTLGYEALGPDGKLIAKCADDLTLQTDLSKTAAPKPGWYRIAGDDARLLRLIMRHADPGDALDKILVPVARLFGTEPMLLPDGMVRLTDSVGASIAIAAPLPGERERPCEIITPPIDDDHAARLEALLQPARLLSFTVPAEGALHIHFDATSLCSASAIANLVAALTRHGEGLKQLVGTNPRCRRLGGWPPELHKVTADPDFARLAWDDARACLGELNLTKYCDFNLTNLIHCRPDKHTFEVRILPASLDTAPILHAAGLFEAILARAVASDPPAAVADRLSEFVAGLPMDAGTQKYWIAACHAKGL